MNKRKAACVCVSIVVVIVAAKHWCSSITTTSIVAVKPSVGWINVIGSLCVRKELVAV